MIISRPLVSIVIPVYNAEKYLSNCLDSILEQKYECIEVILVDDESTDSSSQICKEYVSKRPAMFKYILQQNSGPSAARNKGLDLSQGEYICFVDADDFLPDASIETLVNSAIKYNADIVYANSTLILPDGNRHLNSTIRYRDERIDARNMICRFLSHETVNAVWAKLFRKSTIGTCRFEQGINIGEDTLFNIAILANGKHNIYSISDEVYMYRYSINSLSRRKIDYKLRNQQVMVYIKALTSFSLRNLKSEVYEEYVAMDIIYNLMTTVCYQGILKKIHINDMKVIKKYAPICKNKGLLYVTAKLVSHCSPLIATLIITLVTAPRFVLKSVRFSFRKTIR